MPVNLEPRASKPPPRFIGTIDYGRRNLLVRFAKAEATNARCTRHATVQRQEVQVF